MSNIEGYFRDKAKAATGFFNADGTPARGKPGYMGMEVTGPAPHPAAPQPEGMFQRVGADPKATSLGRAPSLADRGRTLGRAVGGARPAAGGLGAALGAGGVALQGAAMDSDGMRSQFYSDPAVSGFDKLRQGARDIKTLALPAATGIIGGTAGALAGPAGAVAGGLGGAVAGGAADLAIEGALGRSALDRYKGRGAAAGAVTPFKDNSEIIGPGDPRYDQLMNTPNGGIVGQDVLPSEQIGRTTFQTNPFERAATPGAELARQGANFDRFEAPINAALADRVKANGGASTFRDATAQALFNAKQGLNGSGIKVENVNGTPTFSGDNRAGGGQMYRAADGSMTTDWSKTQAYADAIQRNDNDQNRLAELTRGAALSGDKEAVARLTAGDQRLAGIAAEASTEKSLRDAVKRGSRNAAQVLADMEKSRATVATQQADLGLRRATMLGQQEDRDLSRQLRQDALNEKVDARKVAIAKDQRETVQNRLATLDKQLEQYATVDGKVDGQKLARLRGLAANLQPSPGQSPEEFNKDVTTLTSLASKLDDGQGWFDRLTSQAGLGGTDLRRWHANEGFGRGGFVTNEGDHISRTQYNSLTDDEKVAFKKHFLKGDK